jgi:hypothetical protein
LFLDLRITKELCDFGVRPRLGGVAFCALKESCLTTTKPL